MPKLTDGQFAALVDVKRRGANAVISLSAEKALIRLGLIGGISSEITLKGRVTLDNSGTVPSLSQWELVEQVLCIREEMDAERYEREGEAELCGSVDSGDLDACSGCSNCNPQPAKAKPAKPRYDVIRDWYGWTVRDTLTFETVLEHVSKFRAEDRAYRLNREEGPMNDLEVYEVQSLFTIKRGWCVFNTFTSESQAIEVMERNANADRGGSWRVIRKTQVTVAEIRK